MGQRALPRFSRLLISDGLFRLSMRIGFAAILVCAFQHGVSTFDLGIISAATVVPSMVLACCAGWLTKKWGVRIVYVASLMAHSICLWAIPAVQGHFPLLALCAGMMGLLQQMALSSKLSYDAIVVPDALRVRFNAKRAILSSLTVITGPSIAGIVGGYWGGSFALVLAGGASFMAAVLAMKGYPPLTALSPDGETTDTPAGVQVALHQLYLWLRQAEARDLAIQLMAYVAILGVLQMEAPLVFPFVQEIYHRGVDIGGTLLGICGLGSMAGAAFMHAYAKPIRSSWLTTLLAFDGLVLLFAASGHALGITYVLFAFLGIIAAVTMVSIETQVQNTVPAQHHAFLFSLMSFVSGVGGAALVLPAAALADHYGSAMILRSCAWLEIVLGSIATIGLVVAVQRRTPA